MKPWLLDDDEDDDFDDEDDEFNEDDEANDEDEEDDEEDEDGEETWQVGPDCSSAKVRPVLDFGPVTCLD